MRISNPEAIRKAGWLDTETLRDKQQSLRNELRKKFMDEDNCPLEVYKEILDEYEAVSIELLERGDRNESRKHT